MKQQNLFRPSTATGTRCGRGAWRPSVSRSSPRGSPASCPRPSCSSGSMPAPINFALPARGCASCSARSCAAPISSMAGASRTGRLLERQLATICEQGAVGTSHRREQHRYAPPRRDRGHPAAAAPWRQQIGRIIGAMSATSTPHWLDSEPLREPPPDAPRARSGRMGGRTRSSSGSGTAGAVPAGRPDARASRPTGASFASSKAGAPTASTTSTSRDDG